MHSLEFEGRCNLAILVECFDPSFFGWRSKISGGVEGVGGFHSVFLSGWRSLTVEMLALLAISLGVRCSEWRSQIEQCW